MTVNPGDKAPGFDLPTDGEGRLKLSDLKGRKVVLYFYPKDSTPGCTVEAKDFRDRLKDFEKAGAVIVGASKDSVKRHDNFKAKNALPFTLVSDTEGVLCDAYGVWVQKKLFGLSYRGIERATFLIDEKGVVREVWHKVKVQGHADEVLAAVKAKAHPPNCVTFPSNPLSWRNSMSDVQDDDAPDANNEKDEGDGEEEDTEAGEDEAGKGKKGATFSELSAFFRAVNRVFFGLKTRN